MSISRRNMLIGSSAAVALGACSKNPEQRALPPSPTFTNKAYQGDWNKGDQAWESEDQSPTHGEYGKLIDFSTKRVCLIYIEVSAKPFSLDIARIFFEITSAGSNWASVKSDIATLINRLNSAAFPQSQTSSPPWDLFPNETKYKYYTGFQDFAFSEQHHVVFYVRNQGSDFNKRIPLWFGDKLQGSVFGHVKPQGQADWNYSFYNGSRQELILTDPKEWSNAIIYVQNRYQKVNDDKYESIDNSVDKFIYALNINVITYTKDLKLEIPMIIDPDTGNMGEGEP